MQLIKFLAIGAVCLPSVGFARLNNQTEILERQQNTHRQMSQLLDAVRGLSPTEVEDAVRPVVNDKSIMAYTPALAVVVIAANVAATNQMASETNGIKIHPVSEEQFDIKFNN